VLYLTALVGSHTALSIATINSISCSYTQVHFLEVLVGVNIPSGVYDSAYGRSWSQIPVALYSYSVLYILQETIRSHTNGR
jgi:hypothetical protein